MTIDNNWLRLPKEPTKMDLFSCGIGQKILFQKDLNMTETVATVVEKAILPMGFREAYMVRLLYEDGTTQVFDCFETRYTVQLV